MTMAKRKRDMQLNFRVSADELAVIEQKMSQFGTSNREAYLRKMALDGYVVKLRRKKNPCRAYVQPFIKRAVTPKPVTM